ncbi:ABC transporter ATP-binding protein [Streptosporangiaceae bacterium NEAU-GS5]|nr:ABC transporter ATP-binding protein [Streptosporangiaceae bacterium NEAU-GS5]
MGPGDRLLRSAAARARGRLAALTALLAARAMANLATPALLAVALSTALAGRPAVWPVTLLGLAILAGAAAEGAIALSGAAATGASARWLYTTTVRHLLALGGRQPIPPGEATARVVQAVPAAADLASTAAVTAISVLASLGALAGMWWIDWRVGLTFTVALPCAVLLTRRFVSGATATQGGYFQAQAEIGGLLMGALGGIRTIRAAGTTDEEIGRVLGPLPRLAASGHALWGLQRVVVWQFRLLLPLTELLVLAVAGLEVAAGRLAPAQLLAVTGYLAIALGALEHVDSLFELAESRAGAGRLADILDRPAPAGGHRKRPSGPGAVRLRGVTVTRAGQPLLNSLDLDIPAGAAVALVGATGAGKSTLTGLIGRLSDPDRGEVAVDGVPVRELSLPDLRRTVTYAFDRPGLLGGTVHEAIAYGLPDASRADVVAAARASHADAFIGRLPAAYDTPLADAPMSGGERQRMGLARALLRPARVYVLDDATSGLDTVTEAEVAESITTLLAGRTRIVVAHRAATASRCDLVAWLDCGRIRAVAPHETLWADPCYRAVFEPEGDIHIGRMEACDA